MPPRSVTILGRFDGAYVPSMSSSSSSLALRFPCTFVIGGGVLRTISVPAGIRRVVFGGVDSEGESSSSERARLNALDVASRYNLSMSSSSENDAHWSVNRLYYGEG